MVVKRSPFIRLIKKYRVAWAWLTVTLYVLAVPVTIMIFPDNNMWLALVVLFSGFTGAMATLADMLVNAEEAAIKDPHVHN